MHAASRGSAARGNWASSALALPSSGCPKAPSSGPANAMPMSERVSTLVERRRRAGVTGHEGGRASRAERTSSRASLPPVDTRRAAAARFTAGGQPLETYFIIWLALIGLSVGSSLNVVIAGLPEGLSVVATRAARCRFRCRAHAADRARRCPAGTRSTRRWLARPQSKERWYRSADRAASLLRGYRGRRASTTGGPGARRYLG